MLVALVVVAQSQQTPVAEGQQVAAELIEVVAPGIELEAQIEVEPEQQLVAAVAVPVAAAVPMSIVAGNTRAVGWRPPIGRPKRQPDFVDRLESADGRREVVALVIGQLGIGLLAAAAEPVAPATGLDRRPVELEQKRRQVPGLRTQPPPRRKSLIGTSA